MTQLNLDLDPFEQAANEAMTFTAKRRASKVKVVQSEDDAPMKLGPQEQKLADQSRQMRRYHAWKRDQYEQLLRGPQGEQWRALRRVLKHMTIADAAQLVEYVRQQGWLLYANLHMRQVALSLIADAIIKLRIQNGYSPMDDSLPGEPPTVFEILRSELRVLT
ncbi:hypothetical protein ABIF78_007683 [Bradyrhizobium japonicum]|jgi:hypothetical protein